MFGPLPVREIVSGRARHGSRSLRHRRCSVRGPCVRSSAVERGVRAAPSGLDRSWLRRIDKALHKPQKKAVSDRARSWPRFPWFLALLSLAVYTSTLCPTVYGGDSSELAAASASLGVLHSPGYPLYTLLAHLASLVPIGDVAARVNFFSALCSALASGFVATIAWWWTGSRPASVLAWCAWSFAPLVWRYSIVAEVFALNNLLWSAQVALSWKYAMTKSRRWLLAGALVTGLGVAHHPTIVFGSLPLVGWNLIVLLREQRARAWRDILAAFACFVIGLSPYLYLPWAAARVPEMGWGSPDTLDGFFYMLLRKEVGTFNLVQRGAENASAWAGLRGFAVDWTSSFLIFGSVLSILGWIHALRKDCPLRAHSFVLLVASVIYVAVFALMSRLDLAAPLQYEIVARFWQWPYLACALHMALGACVLEAWCRGHGSKELVARTFCLYLPLALFIGRIPFAWHAESNAGERRFTDAGRAVLESMPPGALLLSAGDMWTNLLRYEQVVLHVRPDVTVLDRALLTRPWYARTVKAHHPTVDLPPGVLRAESQPGSYDFAELLSRNAGRFRIFVTEGQNDEQTGDAWRAEFEEHPYGITNELSRPGTLSEGELRDQLVRSFAWLGDLDRRMGPRARRDATWVRELYGALDRGAGRTVRAVLRLGASASPELVVMAKEELARIRAANSGEPPVWVLLLEMELYGSGDVPASDADLGVFDRAYGEYSSRAGGDDSNRGNVERLRRRVLRKRAPPVH
jgi:hypothetical protein